MTISFRSFVLVLALASASGATSAGEVLPDLSALAGQQEASVTVHGQMKYVVMSHAQYVH